MPGVTELEFGHMITILTDTINRVDDRALTRHTETMDRLDAYIASSEQRLRRVENSQLTTAQTISAHEERFKALEISKEERWATRHPILVGLINYGGLIVIFAIVAKFMPGIAHLIGSI